MLQIIPWSRALNFDALSFCQAGKSTVFDEAHQHRCKNQTPMERGEAGEAYAICISRSDKSLDIWKCKDVLYKCCTAVHHCTSLFSDPRSLSIDMFSSRQRRWSLEMWTVWRSRRKDAAPSRTGVWDLSKLNKCRMKWTKDADSQEECWKQQHLEVRRTFKVFFCSIFQLATPGCAGQVHVPFQRWRTAISRTEGGQMTHASQDFFVRHIATI